MTANIRDRVEKMCFLRASVIEGISEMYVGREGAYLTVEGRGSPGKLLPQ